ncbi:hypothetical protein AYO38_00975 [bacterium SCGC AG-212-C10]|nr:hypothetical protein AYO38_00975 [bacterium SCGC AG-212-C10]
MLMRTIPPAWLAVAVLALLLTAFAAKLAVSRLLHPAPAGAAAAEKLQYLPGGATGVDVSWPQCDSQQLPADILGYAVIGVNGGRITSRNDCLEGQFAWAKQADSVPHVYMNTNAPPDGYKHEFCPNDPACAYYQWGWDHTRATVAYARSKNADARYWWLDVETGNYWSNNVFLNAEVLQGAIDYLKSTGHIIGIYSTPRQWGIIAGNYRPHLPNWTAGAADLAEAKKRCTAQYAFGGGTVVMVQYVSEEFDTNYVCPGGVFRGLAIPGLGAD